MRPSARAELLRSGAHGKVHVNEIALVTPRLASRAFVDGRLRQIETGHPMGNLRAEELLQRYATGERSFADQYLFDSNPESRNLRGADLRAADLRGADLNRADLSEANLFGANFSDADLSCVDLTRANLGTATLRGADLSYGKLNAVDLVYADLSGADLTGARLIDANLTRADLCGAILTGADLTGADLTGANLQQANLNAAFLAHVKSVDSAHLSWTSLSNTNLRAFCRGRAVHDSPSIVDYRSVIMTVGEPRLKDFLRRTGMPDVFVEYMVDSARSLDPRQIFSLLRSTFISYGGPDEAFARKLNEELERQGVTTFFFKDDAPPGGRLDSVMRTGVNDHDRVILICSRQSLDRRGLLNELAETLAREARDGGKPYLIPVRLDDYVFCGWSPERPDLAQTLRDRVIADFQHHEDPEAFRAEVAKLIAVLKVQPG